MADELDECKDFGGLVFRMAHERVSAARGMRCQELSSRFCVQEGDLKLLELAGLGRGPPNWLHQLRREELAESCLPSTQLFRPGGGRTEALQSLLIHIGRSHALVTASSALTARSILLRRSLRLLQGILTNWEVEKTVWDRVFSGKGRGMQVSPLQ